MAEMKPSTPGTAGETYETRRRTQRVQIIMPVLVRGKPGKEFFEEPTHTVTVNANGCLVLMATPAKRGQAVSLVNAKTAEELPCKVVFVGQRDGAKVQVGLEFGEASPLFWRITFPPEDWDPSQRKKATAPSQPSPLPRPQQK
ncbi:MAG TPA: hypothetical protein VIC00_05465 [Candidatus Acidoferrales bacterium]